MRSSEALDFGVDEVAKALVDIVEAFAEIINALIYVTAKVREQDVVE